MPKSEDSVELLSKWLKYFITILILVLICHILCILVDILHILCSNYYLPSTGKDQDVGEVLVKSLQNTKYSVDEKLEKSFISLFGRKPDSSSEARSDANNTLENANRIHEIEPLEQYQSGLMEVDRPGLLHDTDDSESSDQDEPVQEKAKFESEGTDEEYHDLLDQKAPVEDHMKEHVEFHQGRLRRKAVFGNDVDSDDLMVM